MVLLKISLEILSINWTNHYDSSNVYRLSSFKKNEWRFIENQKYILSIYISYRITSSWPHRYSWKQRLSLSIIMSCCWNNFQKIMLSSQIKKYLSADFTVYSSVFKNNLKYLELNFSYKPGKVKASVGLSIVGQTYCVTVEHFAYCGP